MNIIIHARAKVKEYFHDFCKTYFQGRNLQIIRNRAQRRDTEKGAETNVKMTNDEYKKYSEAHAPRSRVKRNLLRAFISGGAICALGQLIMALWGAAGLSESDAGTATSITLVALGALLTGLGVYDDLARFAGAGTLVPITGFANAVVAPALEFKTEGLITGTAVKMFTIAGPVIAYGVSASTIYGIILCVLA